MIIVIQKCLDHFVKTYKLTAVHYYGSTLIFIIEFPKPQDISKIIKAKWEIEYNVMVEDPVPVKMLSTPVSYVFNQ